MCCNEIHDSNVDVCAPSAGLAGISISERRERRGERETVGSRLYVVGILTITKLNIHKSVNFFPTLLLLILT